MSITILDCLKLPSLRMGKVIAGKNGLNRIINSVAVLEIIDDAVFDLGKPINSGEMILTSFYSIKDNHKEQCRYIEYMYSIGDTCLVLYYLGIFIKEVHPSVIELADRLDFPIIIMPENRKDFLYNEVIGEVYEAVFRDRAKNKDLIDNITSIMSRLPENVRNIGYLLRVISSHLKVTLVLSDGSLNNVHISKWPVSNEITADEICNLYESLVMKDEYCVETNYEGIQIRIFCMQFTAVEYRNFSIYAVDELENLLLDDMFKVIELLQIFSKLWDLDANNILENALIPAIVEGDENKMRRLASKLQIDISSINTTFIIRPYFGEKNSREQLHLKRDMIKAIKECSQSLGRKIIIDTYGLYIIGVAMVVYSQESDIDYVDRLIDCLDSITLEYTISFFPNDDRVEDVRKTYVLYSEYISYVMDIFPHKKSFSYGDILFGKRCYDIITKKEDEYRICNNMLRQLVDKENDNELLDTLGVYYLDANCKVKKTAELLFVHRNTVQYRMNKIKGITNFKNQDILESYLMHIAIACHRLKSRLK